MGEYINKENLLLKLEEKISYMTLGDDETYKEWWGVTKSIINNTPKIDIVHCEECKWWQRNLHTVFKHYGVCTNTLCCNSAVTEANFFCADGKREE